MVSFAWKTSLSRAELMVDDPEKVDKFLARARGPLQRLTGPQGRLAGRGGDLRRLFELVLSGGLPRPYLVLSLACLHFVSVPVRVHDMVLGRETAEEALDHVVEKLCCACAAT